jgi:hypothetical protein
VACCIDAISSIYSCPDAYTPESALRAAFPCLRQLLKLGGIRVPGLPFFE